MFLLRHYKPKFLLFCRRLCNEASTFNIISSKQERGGVQINNTNFNDERQLIQYKLPLSEIIVDFYDKLKSLSAGYARYVQFIPTLVLQLAVR